MLESDNHTSLVSCPNCEYEMPLGGACPNCDYDPDPEGLLQTNDGWTLNLGGEA